MQLSPFNEMDSRNRLCKSNETGVQTGNTSEINRWPLRLGTTATRPVFIINTVGSKLKGTKFAQIIHNVSKYNHYPSREQDLFVIAPCFWSLSALSFPIDAASSNIGKYGRSFHFPQIFWLWWTA